MEDLKLITENNPLLKQQCEDWNFKADGDPTELITAMTKIMLNPATQGIGLAAPQCGVMKNIFINFLILHFQQKEQRTLHFNVDSPQLLISSTICI